MLDSKLVINGQPMKLTPNETAAMLAALQEFRVSGKGERSYERRKERDLLIYDLHKQGHSDASIGRLVKKSARAVRGAIGRVESGRYGRRW